MWGHTRNFYSFLWSGISHFLTFSFPQQNGEGDFQICKLFGENFPDRPKIGRYLLFGITYPTGLPILKIENLLLFASRFSKLPNLPTRFSNSGINFVGGGGGICRRTHPIDPKNYKDRKFGSRRSLPSKFQVDDSKIDFCNCGLQRGTCTDNCMCMFRATGRNCKN